MKQTHIAARSQRAGEMSQDAHTGGGPHAVDRAGSGQWTLRRSVATATCLALGSVALIIAIALRGLGVTHDLTHSTAVVLDVAKLAFALVAGVGGTVGLVLAYRRHKITEDTAVIDQAKEHREAAKEAREIQRAYNERFGAAASQLGSDQAAVRLAGVYAMAGLADDWLAGRQQCIEVLCANFRRRSPAPPADDAPHGDRLAWQDDREFHRTIIRVIASRLQSSPARASWRGCSFDFTGAQFDGCSFEHVDFAEGSVSFARAQFVGEDTSFMFATFSGASVSFEEAVFDQAYVLFGRCDFTGGFVSFDKATVSAGLLGFDGSSFNSANVSFDRARFTGGEVTFVGASFNSGRVSFTGTEVDGATVQLTSSGFHGCKVHFNHAKFISGKLMFHTSRFAAGDVIFTGAKFLGTEVDLSGLYIWEAPPWFDKDLSAARGLLLPKDKPVRTS